MSDLLSSVIPGELQDFSLEITDNNFNENELKIDWSVDNGTIVKGQGTKILTIIDKEGKDESITVSVNVEIGGICKLSAAESTAPFDPPFLRLFDEIGKISDADIKNRIDMFVTEIENNPGSQGYILNYGSAKDVKKRERLIRNQFNFRGYPTFNIVFMNGGKEKEIHTRFWIVPQGADASDID